ncbi:MAG: hypothetical protein IKZ09_10375 [Clostridia bacterium]|nr:hypothetical protein [Clostridia bacterium]
MKRFLLIFSAVLLMLSMMAIPAMTADSWKAVYTPDKTVVMQGDTVVITGGFPGVGGITGYQVSASYDDSLISLQGNPTECAKNGDTDKAVIFAVDTKNPAKIIAAFADAVKLDDSCFTYTFKVAEQITGTTEIPITFKTQAEFGLKPVEQRTVTVTLKLAGANISGTITSSDSTPASTADDTITVTLANAANTYSTTVISAGNNKTVGYNIQGVVAGTYTMTVSKAGHVTEQYTVVVNGENVTQNATIYLLGDANHDGKADSSDAVAILRKLAGYEVPNFHKDTADFNGDGKADSSDAVAILRKLAGY